jgi:hypothetical protein
MENEVKEGIEDGGNEIDADSDVLDEDCVAESHELQESFVVAVVSCRASANSAVN